MQNLRIVLVALLLVAVLPESAWCQDTGARQPGAAFHSTPITRRTESQ